MINKFMSPEIIFGKGALEHVGESFLRLGARKILIVSDTGVCRAGWVDQVMENCLNAGLEYSTFFNLTTNPKDFEVTYGAQVFAETECDAVLGIGGGSVLDVAKAIAIVATNGGKINDYEGVDKLLAPLPPTIMASTTAGSGSEVSQFSVIVDSEKKKKMTIISKSLIPDISITDPLTLATKDASLTAATGLDVLTHAIEAYVSIAATPLTDVQAKNAIQLVSKYLRPSVATKSNEEAKHAMAMASLQAGLAFSNAILGAVHAISHAVGGRYELSHGEVNSILLPHVMDFNLLAKPERYVEIAELLGVDTRGLQPMEAGKRGIEVIRQLTKEVGAPQHFSELGLHSPDEESMNEMATMALEDACMITNPRDVTTKDIKAIFSRAM
ncbi:MAG: iron-containing alcohol dehydrogenase [Bacillaceae bacterium]|nr:iron-containing alcohol dehydrogenase [Bacillaceae bacterium]